MLFDSGYMFFVLPALLFAMWAQSKVARAYNEYSQVASQRGVPAHVAAKQLLAWQGLDHVQVERVPGVLKDHYDPRSNTLRLSEGVYGSSSLAALAIAAHETGHAVQHGVGYLPLSLRNGLVPLARITSSAWMPLFFIGLMTNSEALMGLGIIFFLGVLLFQVVTLPVEYDASRRGMEMLTASGLIGPSEQVAVGNVLNAAALTYVAATAVSLGQFLRLLRLRGRRD